MDAALRTIMRSDGFRDTFEERREEFVENSVIAVQIANGTFVPVLNTSSNKRRRLVVTTVRDNQTNVKIELFRGSDESMSDPEYVGSLIIENIEPTESGGPDISVLLGVDDSGNLNATATDTRSGEYQSLSVGLDQLDQEGGYDMPDFQLNDEEDFDLATPAELDELTLDDDDGLDSLSLEEPEELSIDEPSADESELEELALDEEDDDDFDLSALEDELNPGVEIEPVSESSESLEPTPL
jgi:molecular chaperone DnaK (HSP70)